MALSYMNKIPGIGEFVPVNRWTCSKHERPIEHTCDCEDCDKDWDCDECAASEWKPAFNPDGTPIMREVQHYESYFGDPLVREQREMNVVLRDLLFGEGKKAKIEWMENGG